MRRRGERRVEGARDVGLIGVGEQEKEGERVGGVGGGWGWEETVVRNGDWNAASIRSDLLPPDGPGKRLFYNSGGLNHVGLVNYC